jgi:hypothetical protein
MVLKKEIIHPFFLNCIQHIIDPFWINVFEDLAYGITPYGTYISKNFICCNYKDKEFSYKIDKSDHQKLYEDIYDLLKNKLGLLSNLDKIKKKNEFFNIEQSLKVGRQNWSSIRKKNVKDMLIEKYVLKMSSLYQLSQHQSKHLNYIIFIAMIFKIITIKDILYENGEIININHIRFLPRQIILEKNIFEYEATRKYVLVDKKLMSDYWYKYILFLKKGRT